MAYGHVLVPRRAAIACETVVRGLFRHSAVCANRADVVDPRSIFDEPRHHGVVNGDLALNPLLKVELIRVDDTRDLLDRGFYF